MDRKIRQKILLLVLLFVAAAVLFVKRNEAVPVSIFSWHWEEMQEKDWQPLLQVMQGLEIQKVYQDFDLDQPYEMREKFWSLLKKENYEAYSLCGDPHWVYPSKLEKILEAIDEAGQLKAESQGILKGIVIDVEPYTMEEWDEEADALMDAYITSMEKAYDAASKFELEVILCIPNFYDKDYEKELETLIRDCCDAVAVMNYSEKDQEEKIRKEAELAHRYGRTFIQISEIKKGGRDEVLRQMQETENLWKSIRKEYPELDLEFSYHHLGALEEAYSEGESYE